MTTHPSLQKNKHENTGQVRNKLLDSDVKKFQALYSTHFNQILDSSEARSNLSLLVRQLEIVYRPVSVSQLERLFSRSARGDVVR